MFGLKNIDRFSFPFEYYIVECFDSYAETILAW